MVKRLVLATRGASTTRSPLRFLLAEARGVQSVHRLRDGPSVVLRHRGRDTAILNEIFARSRRCYEPPSAVPLGRIHRVVDLGANIGLFGAFALARWPGAHIEAFEPDPANADVLERTIEANAATNWHVHRVAVSNRDGMLDFVTGRYSESQAARPGDESVEVPVVDLFKDCEADLLKMDIEGGEWPILADDRLRDLRVPVIVMEWHSRGCPTEPAREAVRTMLHAGGYSNVVEVGGHEHNGQLWAWRDEAG
jgi:FkbM family methyltransferase